MRANTLDADLKIDRQRRRRPWLAAFCLVVLTLAAGQPAPAAPLTAGDRGYGLTVMEGTRIDTFGVEVLGLQRSAALPGRDQILVRLEGLGLENTGILRGMSGSPVYIGGHLVGAVAYGWVYAREPVGLLTPIDEMLALMDRNLEVDPGGATDNPRLPSADQGRDRRGEEGSREIGAPRVGVWLGGGGPATLALSEQLLSPMGLEPLAVPTGGSANDQPTPPPGPGSAVALPLVSGDLSLAVIGTATQVDGGRLVCFGHPFMGTGGIDLPLATARIFGVLDNQIASFKLGAAAQIIGAVRQDRVAGVAGLVGARAPLLPVRVALTGPEGERDFAFSVARHPFLTVSLCQISLLGSLESSAKSMGDASLDLTIGVELADGRRTSWQRSYTGRNAVMMAALGAGTPLRSLVDSPFADVRIAAVQVDARVSEAIRAARIDGARIAQPTTTPGTTVEITARLAPWRGAPRQVVIPVRIPNNVLGPLTVRVGSGTAALAWQDARTGGPAPIDSDALLAHLGRSGAADDLVVEVVTTSPGIALGDRELPAPPPSVRRLLEEPHAAGGIRATPETVVATARLPVGAVLSGEHVLTLTVVPGGHR